MSNKAHKLSCQFCSTEIEKCKVLACSHNEQAYICDYCIIVAIKCMLVKFGELDDKKSLAQFKRKIRRVINFRKPPKK
jgi:NAD-dependent SIR2 family protein deacetylase